jgi:hypothetical protein
MSESEKPSGFVVTDRRVFSTEGEAPKPSESQPAGTSAPSERSEPSRPLPPVDFTTFILSLSSSALMHMGDLPGPQPGPTKRDLPLAKHTIDLLSLLQQKTHGNLSPDEDKLLESVLYDLRLRVVDLAKGGK